GQGQDRRLDRGDGFSFGVVGEAELVEVVAVLAGADDGPLGDRASLVHPLGHLDVVVVGQVRVPGDDGVDVGVRAGDDGTEVRVRVGGGFDVRGRGAFVHEQDHDVRAVGLELVGDAVGLFDDVE